MKLEGSSFLRCRDVQKAFTHFSVPFAQRQKARSAGIWAIGHGPLARTFKWLRWLGSVKSTPLGAIGEKIGFGWGVTSMFIGFHGKITGKSHIFHGKIYGSRWRFSHESRQPIESPSWSIPIWVAWGLPLKRELSCWHTVHLVNSCWLGGYNSY